LGADRPLSALDIRSSFGRAPSKGTLYPMLARLEKQGWLCAKQVAGFRVPKRVYRLTRTGLREARALARQHARMAGGRWIIDTASKAACGQYRQSNEKMATPVRTFPKSERRQER
jgi:DNA-binding PadR family transcriptional regulator